MSAIRRILRAERGYTLIEMLIVLSIMTTVMAGLTTLFVQGSNAELDMNNRFQAQLNARLALDKLRAEVHCASTASPSGSSTSVTITLPTYNGAAVCKTGSGQFTWCTRQIAASRYGLYRVPGTTCSGGVKWADYLTTGTVFNFVPQSTSSLAKLGVDFPVNVRPSKTVELYELKDDIVLHNSTRS